jgi:Spy/CpxP family protein refolding chaperone
MKIELVKKMNILMIISVMLLGVSGNAFAMHHEGNGWGGHDDPKWEEKKAAKMKKMFSELGLSEEQLQKIEANREAKMTAKKGQREQMKAKREALREALDATETDRAQVDQLVNEISAFEAQRTRNHVDHILALKEILTPEQYAALKAKKAEKREKMKEKWAEKGKEMKEKRWGKQQAEAVTEV